MKKILFHRDWSHHLNAPDRPTGLSTARLFCSTFLNFIQIYSTILYFILKWRLKFLLFFQMEYIEPPKVRHKKRGAADLNQTLPGDWFNWVGHFGKSIQVCCWQYQSMFTLFVSTRRTSSNWSWRVHAGLWYQSKSSFESIAITRWNWQACWSFRPCFNRRCWHVKILGS